MEKNPKNDTRQQADPNAEQFARDIAQLQAQVKALEAAAASSSSQQLKYPLDFVSQQIILGFLSVPGPRSFAMGGTPGFGVYYGSGSPNTAISAAKGSLYLNFTGSSTSTRAYINTDGATAWTAVTTAT